ncbi:pali-domain-containing protein [Clavulina sp. PMI_390]|nr:pali-domain-containing protein [Clavulina sp. PMI_390]
MYQFHVGTFLIFAATVMLLVVSLSAPIWDEVGFLRVHGGTGSGTLVLGNWGYCTLMSGGNQCSSRTLGYDMLRIVENFAGESQTTTSSSAARHLTNSFILHPIAAGIAFLAFLTALLSHRIGFLFSSLIAMVATVVTLIALILDWVTFEIAHRHVNHDSSASASWGSAIWLVTVSFILLVLGSVTVCCGCFTDRRRRARY